MDDVYTIGDRKLIYLCFTLDNSSDNLVLLEFNITDDYQKFHRIKGVSKVYKLLIHLLYSF